MAEPEFYSGKTLYPIIAALIALSGLFGVFVMPRLAPAGGDLVAAPAPDFTLPLVANGDAGSRIRLSDLKDKVVILDFWASWCGPCAMQAPILDRVARRHKDVIVLGINVDDAPHIARSYAKQKGLSYPILMDEAGVAQRLYKANTLPTIVMIDKAGNITSFVRGVVREAVVERALTSMLADRG